MSDWQSPTNDSSIRGLNVPDRSSTEYIDCDQEQETNFHLESLPTFVRKNILSLIHEQGLAYDGMMCAVAYLVDCDS